MPGLAALSPKAASVSAVSCAAGGCAAGGYYLGAALRYHAFVTTEKNGRWSRLTKVLSASKAPTPHKISSLSCSGPGNCAAGGGKPAFVASEVNGQWGRAHQFGAEGNNANAKVSCTSAGNCTATWNTFVVAERNGHWGISCTSSVNCLVGGLYPDSHRGSAFVASERNGHWGKAIEVPGIPPPGPPLCEPDSSSCVAGQTLSASCGAGGTCAVGGWYDTPELSGKVAFVALYKNGRWTKVTQIPGLKALDTGKQSAVRSVSCTRTGKCAAGGSYLSTSPQVGRPAFVVDENNGTWGQAHTVRVPS